MVLLRVLILLLSWAAGLGGEARPRAPGTLWPRRTARRQRRPGRAEPSRAARRARQSARPAGGATPARSAPRSLLSPAPRPPSLPWRAKEAPSLRRGLPRPPLPQRQGRRGSPPREAVGRSELPGMSRGAQAGGSIPPACSPGAGTGCRRGAGGLYLPPSAPASARWRILESAPPRGTAAQARGKLRCVPRGWCIVLYRARRSRLTRFCRGAAGGGVTVVPCSSETSRFRSL